jgi:hypothetical protein
MKKVLLSVLALAGFSTAGATSQQAADILITGGTIITMDSARRVIDDGAVAIVGDRIVAVGTSRRSGHGSSRAR